MIGRYQKPIHPLRAVCFSRSSSQSSLRELQGSLHKLAQNPRQYRLYSAPILLLNRCQSAKKGLWSSNSNLICRLPWPGVARQVQWHTCVFVTPTLQISIYRWFSIKKGAWMGLWSVSRYHAFQIPPSPKVRYGECLFYKYDHSSVMFKTTQNQWTRERCLLCSFSQKEINASVCFFCFVGWSRYKSKIPSPTLMFEVVRRWPTIIRIMYFGTNKSMCATLYGSSSRPIQSWSGLVENILTFCLDRIGEPTTFSKSAITRSDVLCCLFCRLSLYISLYLSWSTSALKHIKRPHR